MTVAELAVQHDRIKARVAERARWAEFQRIQERCIAIAEAIWSPRLDAAQRVQQQLAEEMRDRGGRAFLTAGEHPEVLTTEGAIPVPLLTPRSAGKNLGVLHMGNRGFEDRLIALLMEFDATSRAAGTGRDARTLARWLIHRGVTTDAPYDMDETKLAVQESLEDAPRRFTERCPECNAVTVRYCRTCWKPQDTCGHAGNYERRVVSAYENGEPLDRDKRRGELIVALHDGDVETDKGNITSSGDFADYLEERLPWLFAAPVGPPDAPQGEPT